MKINRRTFLKNMTRLIVGGGLTGAAGYGYVTKIEPEWLVVEQVQVSLKNLKPALDGFKIVQLSDFHLYPFTKIELIQEAVALANALKPDLVAFTGDYVLAHPEAIFELAPALASIDAKYGLFAVFGNHDLWAPRNERILKTAFKEVSLPILQNQGITFDVGRAALSVVGLDDALKGQPDLKAALDPLPADVTTLLLVHEPDLADTFVHDGRISLQLSGHSHGGQVRLPGIGAPVLPKLAQKYDQGLYQVQEMWIYTNRGIGLIGPPAIRFNCPPEVTEITLVRA